MRASGCTRAVSATAAEGSIDIPCMIRKLSHPTVKEIAGLLAASHEGDGDLAITAAASIESAGPSEISFIGNRKAFVQAEQSRAGCLIVPATFPNDTGRTIIRTPQPRNAFAIVIG